MRQSCFLVSLLIAIVSDVYAEVLVEADQKEGIILGASSSKSSQVNEALGRENRVERADVGEKFQRQSLSKANASFTYFEDDEEDDYDVREAGGRSIGREVDIGGNVDFRVRRALEMARVSYSIGSRGDFEVKWTIEGQRTHTAYIYSQTYNHDGIEFRKVWAVGFVSNKINANNLLSLLKLNSTYAIGAWEVENLDNGQLAAIFSVNVPANATGDYLRIVSSTVARTADGIELTATREDNL